MRQLPPPAVGNNLGQHQQGRHLLRTHWQAAARLHAQPAQHRGVFYSAHDIENRVAEANHDGATLPPLNFSHAWQGVCSSGDSGELNVAIFSHSMRSIDPQHDGLWPKAPPLQAQLENSGHHPAGLHLRRSGGNVPVARLLRFSMPAIFSLWIVSRNGGLVYSRVGALRARMPVAAVPALAWLASAAFPPARRRTPPAARRTPTARLQDFLPVPALEFNDKLRLASSW